MMTLAKMENQADWRKMLLQYRLNELDDEQREEIDVQLIADPDFSAAMQDAEYDLLDAYASGELSQPDRLRVEKALSPVGRFSLEAPIHIIRSAAPAAVARSKAPSRSLWAWGLAACLLLSLISLFAWRFHAATLERSTSSQLQTAPQPQHQTAPKQPESAVAPAVSPKSAPEQRIKPEPSSMAIVLLPSALRSQNALALHIAASATTVRFVWPSGTETSHPKACQLQVMSEEGIESCRVHGVPSRDNGQPSSFRFDCPAQTMRPGASFVRILPLPSTPGDLPIFEVAVSVR